MWRGLLKTYHNPKQRTPGELKIHCSGNGSIFSLVLIPCMFQKTHPSAYRLHAERKQDFLCTVHTVLRLTEQLRLAGTSGDHLHQPSCTSRLLRTVSSQLLKISTDGDSSLNESPNNMQEIQFLPPEQLKIHQQRISHLTKRKSFMTADPALSEQHIYVPYASQKCTPQTPQHTKKKKNPTNH